MSEQDAKLEIAFGLRDALAELKYLAPHALNFSDLNLDPRAANFAAELRRYMGIASRIHFSLTYMNCINAPDGILECFPQANLPGSANWELRTIWDDPILRAKTIFYSYGKVITEVQVLSLQ